MLSCLRPAPQGRGYRIRKRANHVTPPLRRHSSTTKQPKKTNKRWDRKLIRLATARASSAAGTPTGMAAKSMATTCSEGFQSPQNTWRSVSLSSVLLRIVIERTLKLITITILHLTSRPHHRQGRPGMSTSSRKSSAKITEKDVQINIYEVKRPELDAQDCCCQHRTPD